jgi:hypothetical protein
MVSGNYMLLSADIPLFVTDQNLPNGQTLIKRFFPNPPPRLTGCGFLQSCSRIGLFNSYPSSA